MTFIAVPIVVETPDDTAEALARAEAVVAAGARLIEWRVDELPGLAGGADAARRLVAESPAPCIVTVRSAREGGVFDGAEDDRVALLRAVLGADVPPRYADVERVAYESSAVLREALVRIDDGADLATSVIHSVHDFDGRPGDLYQRIEAMTADPACDVIKVAWMARSLRDNLQAFDVLRERRKPTIAICMGPFGEISRVLAPKFGGLLTFAAEAEDAPTAPGQLTIAELRRLRYDAISAATRVYGVIGWPVGHSRSPDVHNAGFAAVGHDGVYLPLPIPPEPEHLKATLGAFLDHAALDFAGASVTIPHKTNVLQFVEARGGTIDPLAARVGAANTLVVRDGRLVCANTDVDAAIDALTAAMNVDRAALADQRALVLGAGGVARAVVAGLAAAGAVVVIAARRSDRAAALASDLDAGTGRVSAAEVSELAGERFDVIVNATPVGMTGGPAPGESPLPDGVTIDDGVTVLDTVYSPSRTPLLEDVATRGARIVPGIEMFIRQAARQFELWTGQRAPEPVFRRALLATD